MQYLSPYRCVHGSNTQHAVAAPDLQLRADTTPSQDDVDWDPESLYLQAQSAESPAHLSSIAP